MKSQAGRSMVEMLGVLAIIGVLSIGGIAGYQIAMEKYKINEVINAYNLLLVEALPQVEKCNNFTVSIQNMDGDVRCEKTTAQWVALSLGPLGWIQLT